MEPNSLPRSSFKQLPVTIRPSATKSTANTSCRPEVAITAMPPVCSAVTQPAMLMPSEVKVHTSRNATGT